MEKIIDLDETFIGQWEIVRVDDYLTPKAGTAPIIAIVRSKKDLDLGIITFYSVIHQKFKNDPIPMDGSVGIMGRITERFEVNPPGLNRIEVIYLHCISGSDILEKIENKDEDMIIKGTCEFDDICWQKEKYSSMDITYYIRGEKTRYLWGMELVIPIALYNNYVKMRDLWYRDYKGCQAILHPL
uniref:Uncharacterized protein n=1 Tax=Marseillevirus LCMAC101 TaxID=2506602 RepID=A0A481YSH0_9VIRU|nr:MAG: hypothetical protein LCMAC101_05940 [Marseillevirus LCMAC101]